MSDEHLEQQGKNEARAPISHTFLIIRNITIKVYLGDLAPSLWSVDYKGAELQRKQPTCMWGIYEEHMNKH